MKIRKEYVASPVLEEKYTEKSMEIPVISGALYLSITLSDN